MKFLKNTAVLSAYLLLAAGALLGAVYLRFDFTPPVSMIAVLITAVPILIAVKGFVFYTVGLHRNWWHIAEIADLIQLITANVIASAAFTLSGAFGFYVKYSPFTSLL